MCVCPLACVSAPDEGGCLASVNRAMLLIGCREFWRQTMSPKVRKEYPKYEPKLHLDEGFVAPSVSVTFGELCAGCCFPPLWGGWCPFVSRTLRELYVPVVC